MILEEAVKQASNELRKENINSHQLDAELILSDIMGVSREFLILNSELIIKKNTLKKLARYSVFQYFQVFGDRNDQKHVNNGQKS